MVYLPLDTTSEYETQLSRFRKSTWNQMKQTKNKSEFESMLELRRKWTVAKRMFGQFEKARSVGLVFETVQQKKAAEKKKKD